MKRTIYRDSITGRFAKKSTWSRSHAQGGTRYKRQQVTVTPKAEPQGVYPEEYEDVDVWEEWDIDFDY